MTRTTLTRRTLLRTAAMATTALAAPFVRGAHAAGNVVPDGSMALAWHTNIAPRWLDPLQHDGGATPDNFLNALQDALIKNFRTQLYDHLALAERYDFAEDAKSATFRLRPGIKFHNGDPVTPADFKWSYEHYHGAWAKVLQDKTAGVETPDDHTVRFVFKEAFLDFPRLIGTANVCGAGWVVPAKYYQEVGEDGFVAEADRRRALPAGLAGTRNQARVRGLRRLLPTGARQDGSRSSACRTRPLASRCSNAAKRTSFTTSPESWSRASRPIRT